jgi:5'-3' exonuclease
VKRPPRYKEKVESKKLETLIVDGNALLNVAYHGAKDLYNSDGNHIGGLFQFFTTLRKIILDQEPNKLFIFWDGKFSGKLRYEIYSEYKSNRDKNYHYDGPSDDPIRDLQKIRIQQYAEELFIRQYEDDIVEADDCIAYYCNTMSSVENITICTGDKDLCQLIDDNVRIYYLSKKKFITKENYQTFFSHHYENATLVKVITGDSSDNIKGIKGVQEKTLLKLIPKIIEKKVTIKEIFSILVEEQHKRKKPLKAIENILNSVTDGIQKENIYEINDKIINLKNPLLTEKVIYEINNLIDSPIDPEGRDNKNLFRMMIDDKFFNEIPGKEDGYIEYLRPFLKLIKKEKELFKNN